MKVEVEGDNIEVYEVEVGKVDDEIVEKHGMTGNDVEIGGVNRVDDKIREKHDGVGKVGGEVFIEVLGDIGVLSFSVKAQNLRISPCPGEASDTA